MQIRRAARDLDVLARALTQAGATEAVASLTRILADLDGVRQEVTVIPTGSADRLLTPERVSLSRVVATAPVPTDDATSMRLEARSQPCCDGIPTLLEALDEVGAASDGPSPRNAPGRHHAARPRVPADASWHVTTPRVWSPSTSLPTPAPASFPWENRFPHPSTRRALKRSLPYQARGLDV
jgi:hypothetical protein